jgi:trans-aconitate 2-methyltransferase
VKGTTLTRFKRALGDEGFEEYLERYRVRLLDEVGDQAPYLYPFKRILMWARRS